MKKIAQITDIHLTSNGKLLRGEVDPYKRFNETISDVLMFSPDLIVISGDIAAEYGSIDVYNYAKSRLESLNIEFCIMSGNHDDSKLIMDCFNLGYSNSDSELYYSIDLEDFKVVFLDSSKSFLSRRQLDWLVDLDNNTNEIIIIFVHHPLSFCACQHMDKKYPLLNIEEVQYTLKKLKHVKYIFTGHYHTEKEVNVLGIRQFLTPSTVFQIDPFEFKCVADYKLFGWRTIVLDKDKLKTKVKYLKEE